MSTSRIMTVRLPSPIKPGWRWALPGENPRNAGKYQWSDGRIQSNGPADFNNFHHNGPTFNGWGRIPSGYILRIRKPRK